MNLVVNRESGDVDGPTSLDDPALSIDAHQIGCLYLPKVHAKWINPKSVGENGIAHCDMAANAFANSEGCKNSKASR